jgi:hypothetical protein
METALERSCLAEPQMNELLAKAIAAHGGLDRWNKLNKVS